MHRNDLAALPEPRYLLYPHPWLYRALTAVQVLAFTAFLSWFVPLLLIGQAEVEHWLLAGFMCLINKDVLQPKGRDWRKLISFAATPKGAWFVTNNQGECEFVPWSRIRRVYVSSISGRASAVKGVVFEIDVDAACWRRLNGHPQRVIAPRTPSGYYLLGLSANLRPPRQIIAAVEQLRALCSEPQPNLLA